MPGNLKELIYKAGRDSEEAVRNVHKRWRDHQGVILTSISWTWMRRSATNIAMKSYT